MSTILLAQNLILPEHCISATEQEGAFWPLPTPNSANTGSFKPAISGTPADFSYDGTATAAGSTTTIVDERLKVYGEGFFIGFTVTFTGGANETGTKTVTAFAAATGTLTWSGALTSTVIGDTFTLSLNYATADIRLELTASGDAGDAAFKVSFDGGVNYLGRDAPYQATWEDKTGIAAGGKSASYVGFVTNADNNLVLVYQDDNDTNDAAKALIVSDNGMTVSEPVNITGSSSGLVYCAVCLKKAPYLGRILAHIYVGGSAAKTYYSDDGGATWAQLNSYNQKMVSMRELSSGSIAGLLDDSNTLKYVKSTDGGKTWSTGVTIYTGGANVIYGADIEELADGTLFVVCSLSDGAAHWHIYKYTSTTGGATWSSYTSIAADSGTDHYKYPRCIRDINDDIYVFWCNDTDDKILFDRSTDNGSTWGGELSALTDTAIDPRRMGVTILNGIDMVMAVECEAAAGAELTTNGTMESNADWSSYGSPTSTAQDTGTYHAGAASWKFVVTPVDLMSSLNGDMELDSGWDSYSCPDNGRTSAKAHGGTYSWYFTGLSEGDGIIQSTGMTGLTVGRTYYVEFYALGGMPVGISYNGASETDHFAINPFTWTQCQTSFVADSTTVKIRFVLFMSGSTTIYIDDVKVIDPTQAHGVRQEAAHEWTTTSNTYHVVSYVYPDDTTSVRVLVRKGDDSGFAYDIVHTGLTENAWNLVEFNYVESAGGAHAYIAFCNGTLGETDFGAMSWYVDDVSVKVIGGAVYSLRRGKLETYAAGYGVPCASDARAQKLICGVSVSWYGGSGVSGDKWTVEADHDYSMVNILDGSPSYPWRSETDGADCAIVIDAGSGFKFYADGAAIFGCNVRTVSIQMNASDSWGSPSVDEDVSFDLTTAGVLDAATDSNLLYDAALLASYKPHELAGAMVCFTSGGGVGLSYRILDNTGDYIVLDVDAAVTAHALGDTFAIYKTQAIRVFTDVDKGPYRFIRIQIDAQETPDGYYQIGVALIGKSTILTETVKPGYNEDHVYDVELLRTPHGGAIPVKGSNMARRFSLEWPLSAAGYKEALAAFDLINGAGGVCFCPDSTSVTECYMVQVVGNGIQAVDVIPGYNTLALDLEEII